MGFLGMSNQWSIPGLSHLRTVPVQRYAAANRAGIQRDKFFTQCRTLRAVSTRTGRSPLCRVARLGVNKAELETLRTRADASWAVLALLGQQRICCTKCRSTYSSGGKLGEGIH